MIIDGRKIRDDIFENISRESSSLTRRGIFCDVLVGDNPVSTQYAEMKKKMAERAGFDAMIANFPETLSTGDLVVGIKKLNSIENICGIIVQLPLPEHIDKKSVLDAIDPELDVDCLGSENLNLFYSNKGVFYPPTALAILKILEEIPVSLKSLEILVLGQGDLVGKPVSFLLENKGYSIKRADINTQNTSELLKTADVIISAIGKPRFISYDMIKKGVVLIDAGTAEENGKIYGDVDIDSVSKSASFVSPVPGGVGPVTVAMLLSNILKSAKNHGF